MPHAPRNLWPDPIPGWVRDLLDGTIEPVPVEGRMSMTITHRAPDGTKRTVEYLDLDASGSEGMAMVGMDYDWPEPLSGIVVQPARTPSRVMLRLLLSAEMLAEPDTGHVSIETITEPPAALARVRAYADAFPTLYEDEGSEPMPEGLVIDTATDWTEKPPDAYGIRSHPAVDLTYADLLAVLTLAEKGANA